MANRYWRGITTANWNNTSNWSTTSGGAIGASFPVVGDTAFFDKNGDNPCTINTTSACDSVIVSNGGVGVGYTKNWNMAASLTVTNTLTLGDHQTISNTAQLVVNSTATTPTITFNGCHPVAMSLTGTGTITLVDNPTITGVFTIGNASGTLNVNKTGAGAGDVITLSASSGNMLSAVSSGQIVSNGIKIVLAGTGAWTGGGQLNGFNMDINSSGTVTMSYTALYFSNGTLTYVAGTVVTTGGGISFAGTTTVNTGASCVFNNVTTAIGSVVTIATNDIYVAGQSLIGQGTGGTINGRTWHAQGNLTGGGGGSTSGGTTLMSIDGTGTQTWSGNQCFQFPLKINKASGTLNITGPVSYSNNTITYTAGTVSVTGALNIVGIGITTTFNTAGMTWSSILIAYATTTLTLNSTITLSGTFTIQTTPTVFNGTSGFNVNTFTDVHSGDTITLQSGIEYIVTNAITLGVTSSVPTLTLKSSTATSPAYLTLINGATQTVRNTSATDIDSSRGMTIWCWLPTLLRTVNWLSLLPSSTIGASKGFFN